MKLSLFYLSKHCCYSRGSLGTFSVTANVILILHSSLGSCLNPPSPFPHTRPPGMSLAESSGQRGEHGVNLEVRVAVDRSRSASLGVWDYLGHRPSPQVTWYRLIRQKLTSDRETVWRTKKGLQGQFWNPYLEVIQVDTRTILKPISPCYAYTSCKLNTRICCYGS